MIQPKLLAVTQFGVLGSLIHTRFQPGGKGTAEEVFNRFNGFRYLVSE